MDRYSPYALPWSTPPLWQAANQSLADMIVNYRGELQHLVALAGRIRERLTAVDVHMVDLCRQTCAQCQAICCRHAHAYFDFKDLLYLHLGSDRLPARQTLGKAQQICCYLGRHGCHLPRTERPFICTWYLCPAQTAILEKEAVSRKVFILNSLKALKWGRDKLQSGYLHTTTAVTTGEYSL